MNPPTSANPQGIPQRPTPDAEATDVSVRGVLFFIGILVVSGVIIHIALWWMERHFAKLEGRSDRQITEQQVRTDVSKSRPNFPEPRLQVAPRADLSAFRAKEEAELNSYGWVNQTAGVVRIPIHRAMELLVQRGLPVRDPNEKGKSSLELIRERAQTK